MSDRPFLPNERERPAALGAAEMAHLVCLMLSSGDPIERAARAERNWGRPCPPRIVETLKAAVAGGNLSDANWAGSLAAYRLISQSFAQSLQGISCFEFALGNGAVVLPLDRMRIVSVSRAGVGAVGEPGAMKPVTRLSLSSVSVTPTKASALVVISDELQRILMEEGMRLLSRELRYAVANACDTALAAFIASASVSIPSLGSSPEAVKQDIVAAVAAVRLGAGSRPFICMRPEDTAACSVMVDTATGAFSFPQLSPTGGSVQGLPVVASAGLPEGEWILIDAAALALSSGPLTLATSNAAALAMNDAPSAGPQALTSLYQTNSRALLAERLVSMEFARDFGAAIISNVAYGAPGT